MKNLFAFALPALLALSLLSRPSVAQPAAMTAQGVLDAAAQTYADFREYKGTCAALIDGAASTDGAPPQQIVSSATSRFAFERGKNLKVIGDTMFGGSYTALSTPTQSSIDIVPDKGETTRLFDKTVADEDAMTEFLASITGISGNSGYMTPAALLTDGELNPFRAQGILELLPEQNLGTTPCYVVRQTDEERKSVSTLWIEKESFLLRRFEQDMGATKTPELTEADLEKYPQLKGMKMPSVMMLYTKRLLVFSNEVAR